MQICVIETNYFPVLSFYMETLSLILLLWVTLHIVPSQSEKCTKRKKTPIVLYFSWHGELEFLNSAFLIPIGTWLYTGFFTLLWVVSLTYIFVLRVAVGRVASAAPIAIESGNWRKKIYQRELTLQTEENMTLWDQLCSHFRMIFLHLVKNSRN